MKVLLCDATIRGYAIAIADSAQKKILWQSQNFKSTGTSHELAEVLKNGLQESKVKDIDAIAVAVGPGSFTGIRIGLAFTLGFAAGCKKPIKWLGYSSLQEFANATSTTSVLKSTQEFGYIATPSKPSAEVLHLKNIKDLSGVSLQMIDTWPEFEAIVKTKKISHVKFEQLIERNWNHLLHSWTSRMLDETPPRAQYLRPSSVEEKQIGLT